MIAKAIGAVLMVLSFFIAPFYVIHDMAKVNADNIINWLKEKL